MIKNLKELMQKFSDEDVCRRLLIQQRWNGVPVCPYCNSEKAYLIEGGKRFKCGNSACYKKYSVTVGTVFHASNIPLSTWFPAMYLISAHKKGISSVQLAKDLGVTQKTAWFMLHRIRESLKEKNSPLISGIVEIDETYIGGKMKNKHFKVRKDNAENQKSSTVNKAGVMGMLERDKGIRLEVIEDKTFGEIVAKNVAKDSILITDAAPPYTKIGRKYKQHEIVNHVHDEFVRGQWHTNSIEGFFSHLKRSIYGCYHKVSHKHLQAYCNETAYRYNTRHLQDGNRFELTLGQIEGRLTYKQLVYGKGNQTSKESKA